MPLLKLDNLSLAYGQQVLFDSIQLLLNKGDRLCLVGRNGVGKSTLLKVIEGFVESDGGSRWLDTAVKVAGLSQDLPEANDERVLDFVASGLAQLGQDLAQYQRCIEAPIPILTCWRNCKAALKRWMAGACKIVLNRCSAAWS